MIPSLHFLHQAAPRGVGFVRLGKGRQVFEKPVIPKNPKLARSLIAPGTERPHMENVVFFCVAKTCQCLLMITEMDKKKETISFEWRILKNRKATSER